MIVLVPEITPRLEYVFDFVFSEALKIEYAFCEDKNEFLSSENRAKWSYGLDNTSFPYLPAERLLFESKIDPKSIFFEHDQDITPLYFQENYTDGHFDIFAAIFYLISRYEEYIPHVQDHHGRYIPEQSIAFRAGFLDKLMVNRYIVWLQHWLEKHSLIQKKNTLSSTFKMTIDIDHPFYAHDIFWSKKLPRKLKNAFNHSSKDRYDTFDYISSKVQMKDLYFFWLFPIEHSSMDGYHLVNSEAYQALLLQHSEDAQYGIHPSYFSESKKWIKKEKKQLEEKARKSIKASRMHYLRANMPNTYQSLIEAGLSEDFSMQYSSKIGWRSSTNIPYYFFDLTKNTKTKLLIHSGCFMDSHFFYKENSHEQTDSILNLVNETKKYGGEFIPIFHNDLLAHKEVKNLFELVLNSFKNS